MVIQIIGFKVFVIFDCKSFFLLRIAPNVFLATLEHFSMNILALL